MIYSRMVYVNFELPSLGANFVDLVLTRQGSEDSWLFDYHPNGNGCYLIFRKLDLPLRL